MIKFCNFTILLSLSLSFLQTFYAFLFQLATQFLKYSKKILLHAAPGSIHGHHHHTSLREQLQFTTAIPQSTAGNVPGAPRSIFNRLGIRKPSILSLSSPNPTPSGGGAAARTFSLDDLLRPPPRRKIERS